MSDSRTPSSQRLAIHFTHLRPYHLARLRSAELAFADSGIEVHGFALIDATGDLPADLPIARPLRPPVILFPGLAEAPPSTAQIKSTTRAFLDQLAPTSIAICGYATADARACHRWARRHQAKAILMTETREQDGERVWWKEAIKSRIVRTFDAALCGGPESRAYLEKLGMSANRIAEGYDTVDNEYFANESDRIRAAEGGTVHPYFLASNRFIPRKNVAGLIDAFSSYIQSISSPTTDNGQPTTDHSPWNLCLLGDGELKPDLIAQCHRLGLQVSESAPWKIPTPSSNQKSTIVSHQSIQPLPRQLTTDNGQPTTLPSSSSSPDLKTLRPSDLPTSPATSSQTTDHGHPTTLSPSSPTSSLPQTTDNGQPTTLPLPTVFFPGWRSLAELPRFYAHAGSFVHPAFSEPWGLVVNEAMACGLPLLLSPGTGAAASLLGTGSNGEMVNVQSIENFSSSLKTFADNHGASAINHRQASRAVLAGRAPTSAFGSALAKLSSV